jgi:hypothetical protein
VALFGDVVKRDGHVWTLRPHPEIGEAKLSARFYDLSQKANVLATVDVTPKEPWRISMAALEALFGGKVVDLPPEPDGGFAAVAINGQASATRFASSIIFQFAETQVPEDRGVDLTVTEISLRRFFHEIPPTAVWNPGGDQTR